MNLKCIAPWCDSTVHAKRMCNRHYRRALKLFRRKPCACGCGELTAYAYKHGHHTRLFSSEEQSRRGRMNTGDAQRDTGACLTYRKYKGRHEHRIVAEKMMGRALSPREIVHHRDGNIRHNSPENLMIMTQAKHARLHNRERKRARRTS